MINTGDLVKFKVYGKEFIGEVIGVLEEKIIAVYTMKTT